MHNSKFRSTPQDVPFVESKYRRIKTKIPVPESLDILDQLNQYESVSMHGQLPVVWDRAEGFQVCDPWGNRWLDFTSTIFVANSGHGNPRIVERLTDLLNKPILHSYNYPTIERAEYLKYLIEKTPNQFEKAFLLSAGTETTECALKLMRMHGAKTGKMRPGIISFEGGWHGRTMGAQMMSFNPLQKEWIGYHDPNIFHLPFPYPWNEESINDPVSFFRESIEKLAAGEGLNLETDICGFMLESFQGWGAVFYPPEFVREISDFSKKRGIIVSFDEMQSGFGRTGELFGYMHYGVEPDIICCGKGASSSLPLSIVMSRREIMDLPAIGSMSSTHSANPMSCAAGKANLEEILEGGLIENSKALGNIFHEKLNGIMRRFPLFISHVLGKGLLAALHFRNENGIPLSGLCDAICEKAMQRGLLVVHTGRESIKLAPPLMIDEDALSEGIDVLESAIDDSIEELFH